MRLALAQIARYYAGMSNRSQQKRTDKIPIGVSSCLLGNRVRYDGGHKYNSIIDELFSTGFDLIAVCPETGIGLGVPRPPIQLLKQQAQVRAVGVEDKTIDVTDALHDYAQRIMKDHRKLCGFIFKARSPSCGIGSSDLFDAQGTYLDKTSGIFAATLQQINPKLPVIDEDSLALDENWKRFIERVNEFHRQQ